MSKLQVYENGQRGGEQGYVHVRAFISGAALQKWVEKNGKPVWVVRAESAADGVKEVSLKAQKWQYWNSGAGWQWGWMPKLPLVG